MLFIALAALALDAYASRPVPKENAQVFTVSRTATSSDIGQKISQQTWMQGRPLFGLFLLMHGGYWFTLPGGYYIDPHMSSWRLAAVLTHPPALTWTVIPPGLRKEQVALRLQKTLGWNDAKRRNFLTLIEKDQTPYDLTEGFLFPDNYLFTKDDTEEQVLKKFIDRFNQAFDPLLPDLRKQNIKDDTAVKLASILQREAAGKDDMPLIAGILWNRLLGKMPLGIDATLQYARGDTGSGYWAPIGSEAKTIDSPFNTYLHPGLPPEPISNPGLDAIEAVIHPADTKCLYYLHDRKRQIHCSESYAGHLENIDVYLKMTQKE